MALKINKPLLCHGAVLLAKYFQETNTNSMLLMNCFIEGKYQTVRFSVLMKVSDIDSLQK